MLYDHHNSAHTRPQSKDYQIKRKMDKLLKSYSYPKKRFEEITSIIEV